MDTRKKNQVPITAIHPRTKTAVFHYSVILSKQSISFISVVLIVKTIAPNNVKRNFKALPQAALP